MKNKKMGRLQLGGLITGAVLGSGIILLPPIALVSLDQWSVVGWGAIMILGAVFASLFAQLAQRYPGSEGVPIAVRKAFGQRAGDLASSYIICAVCVGPVAVLMTAADGIARTFQWPSGSMPLISAALLLICFFLLIHRVTVLGTVALLATIFTGVILTAGSIMTIAADPVIPWPHTTFEATTMGQTLLVLFWAIVGWEVIGNYTMDVRNPGRTIPQATALGILSISGIYLLVAWAMFASSRGQVPGSEQTTVSVAQIITVIFGSYSNFVIMICTSVLCICTYLMIVGGISRLMETLAGDGRLPSFLSLSSKQGVPVSALATLTCFHIADLMLLHSGLITLEQLISLANVFFLANSLIAVASAMRLIPSLKLRVPCIILILGFIALLSFSSFWSLLGLAMVTIYVFKTSRVRHK